MNQKATGASPSVAVENAAEKNPLILRAQAVITKMPESPIGHTQLAAAYIRIARETDDFDLNSKAEAAVGRALELDPSDLTARKLQASLHLTLHRFEEGLAVGTQLQKEYPHDHFVYGILADANAELGNYPQAVEAAQKMMSLRPNTASYARAGNLRLLHGDYRGAVEAYQLAAKTANPADPEAQSWCFAQLGNSHWANGKYMEAIAEFDRALQLVPGYRIAVLGKARALASKGDLDGAARLLEGSRGGEPEPDISILLSQIYEKQGDTERAKLLFVEGEAAERKNLGVPSEQKHLAKLWADYEVNLQQALEIAQAEYARQKDIYTADTLAWCLYKNGRYEEAKAMSDKAMSLKTQDASILFHAAMIRNALGKHAEARELFKQARMLNLEFDLRKAETLRREAGLVRG